ncbi:hypothetical protein H0N99_02450 [Candidatus Micrarchaeota archaeon]|nr:hypothetical protein [Candidatus Micrarchaeota archaeon]
MEQSPNNEILESQLKKETYLLRVKKRFQNTKHFAIKKKYKEEENPLAERATTIFKKLGWIKEGQR